MPYKYMKLRGLLFRNNADRNLKQMNEDDFKNGIKFHAKFVGSLEISRPVSRVEIVSAMRRVRFEFRVRGAKKKRVSLDVSVDGVQVNIANKKKTLISHHPISKIFYVSHDSQDLKIFSFITSNETSKIFRCNVFKSYKMSQAVQIVKTIGQAFDVCHKLSIENNKQYCQPLPEIARSPDENRLIRAEDCNPTKSPPQDVFNPSLQRPHFNTIDSTDKYKITNVDSRSFPRSGVHHEERWNIMRREVMEHKQQNDLILMQMQLIHNQLETEHSARINAEVQLQDLIRENQNLLFRIHSMMRQLLIKNDNPKDMSTKNNEVELSANNMDASLDATFYHQSPDSGHDDTISSTLSRFRNPNNTWGSSSCHFQLEDERCLNDGEDSKEKSEVIENSFNHTNISTAPGISLLKEPLSASKIYFSKHLPVSG